MAKKMTKHEKWIKERNKIEELKGRLSAYGFDEDGEYEVNAPSARRKKDRRWSLSLVCTCCEEGVIDHDAFSSKTELRMYQKALACVQDDGKMEGH